MPEAFAIDHEQTAWTRYCVRASEATPREQSLSSGRTDKRPVAILAGLWNFQLILKGKAVAVQVAETIAWSELRRFFMQYLSWVCYILPLRVYLSER